MFEGLSLRHDRGGLVRAVLEGVAYGLRDSLELLRGLGVDAQVGRASGGGARSRLWLEIVASVLGIPLELTEVEEGSAYGAALLAGVSNGVFASARGGGRRVRPRARQRSSRTRRGAGCTTRAMLATARCIRPSNLWRGDERTSPSGGGSSRPPTSTGS